MKIDGLEHIVLQESNNCSCALVANVAAVLWLEIEFIKEWKRGGSSIPYYNSHSLRLLPG